MDFVRSVEMKLRGGETLTIDMSSQLLEQVRHAHALDSIEHVTERHVRNFLVSSMTNLLEACDE